MTAIIKGSTHRPRGSRDIATTIRNNEIYTAQLKYVVEGLGKKVLGVLAATALHNAMTATVKDSVRAAANWNILVGKGTPSSDLNPYKFGTDPIGYSGEHGEKWQAVLDYKRNYYGYEADGKYQVPTPGGLIDTLLGIGKLGSVKSVQLYNPVFSNRYMRTKYPLHAFGGEGIDQLVAGGPVSLNSVTNDYIPKLIDNLGREIYLKGGAGRFK